MPVCLHTLRGFPSTRREARATVYLWIGTQERYATGLLRSPRDPAIDQAQAVRRTNTWGAIQGGWGCHSFAEYGERVMCERALLK